MPAALGMPQLFPQGNGSDVLLVGAETEHYNSRPSNSLRGSNTMTGAGKAIFIPMAFNKSCDECGIRKRKCDGNRPCRYRRRSPMVVVIVLTCGLWHLLISTGGGVATQRGYICSNKWFFLETTPLVWDPPQRIELDYSSLLRHIKASLNVSCWTARILSFLLLR